MTIKQKIINHTMGLEGGEVNHPDDSGGHTKYGVTEALARATGYQGSMADLSYTTAFFILDNEFWQPLKLDNIVLQSQLIATELFDSSVNCSPKQAATWLQVALNAFNKKATLYPDLITDGILGSKTLSALSTYLQERGRYGEVVMNRALNAQQGQFYLDLTQRREKDESFVFGWFKHRVM